MPYKMSPEFRKRIEDDVLRVVAEVYPKGTITGHSLGFAASDAIKYLIGCCEGFLLCEIEEGVAPYEMAFGDDEIKSRLEDTKYLMSLDNRFCHYYCAEIIWSVMGGEKYGISKFNYKEKFPNHEECLDVVRQLIASTNDDGVTEMLRKAHLLTHAIYDFNQLLRYRDNKLSERVQYIKSQLRWGLTDKPVL